MLSQGLWNRSCTHLETERGAAASCFERMRWRERKRRNSSSSSLSGNVWRARAMPALWPRCDAGGFVVQEPSSGAAFPYRRITCLPGIIKQHLTALIHPPRDCGTHAPQWFMIFEGTFSCVSSRRGKRAAEREPRELGGIQVALGASSPRGSKAQPMLSSSSSQATKITETCKATPSPAAKLGLSFVLQSLVSPRSPFAEVFRGEKKNVAGLRPFLDFASPHSS